MSVSTKKERKKRLNRSESTSALDECITNCLQRFYNYDDLTNLPITRTISEPNISKTEKPKMFEKDMENGSEDGKDNKITIKLALKIDKETELEKFYHDSSGNVIVKIKGKSFIIPLKEILSSTENITNILNGTFHDYINRPLEIDSAESSTEEDSVTSSTQDSGPFSAQYDDSEPPSAQYESVTTSAEDDPITISTYSDSNESSEASLTSLYSDLETSSDSENWSTSEESEDSECSDEYYSFETTEEDKNNLIFKKSS